VGTCTELDMYTEKKPGSVAHVCMLREAREQLLRESSTLTGLNHESGVLQFAKSGQVLDSDGGTICGSPSFYHVL
jgi:hypothetical protein